MLDTFTITIVTTDANVAMLPLYDRMPVILAPADYTAWLDGLTPPEQVQALIRPCAEAMLAAHPVRRPSATSATIGRS